jgi:GNAT superfamily N-acetyltransferase
MTRVILPVAFGSVMLSLVIRPASFADIPSIAKVRSGALTDQEISGFTVPGSGQYYSKEKLTEMWDANNRLKDDSEVFVAATGGRVIGFIVFNMNNCDDNIDNVVVAKKEQGKGVGRALVVYVEDLAKSRRMDVITTDTTEKVFLGKLMIFGRKWVMKIQGKGHLQVAILESFLWLRD